MSTIASSTSAQQVLENNFGYTQFRPGQADVIAAVLESKDTLVLMPTGGGKSLCYQVPALVLPGVTIVVSPLISLMKDQVDGLLANGINAAYINSSLPRQEVLRIFNAVRYGEIKLLYVAPERLMRDEFLSRLYELPLSLIAIDEAHCVSHWGHDFRPDYARMGQLKQHFPSVPLLALTATADKATRQDIQFQLQLQDPFLHVSSFDRPNIRYILEEKYKPRQQVLTYIKEQNGQSGVIYCTSRNRVDELTAFLCSQGINASGYHAGLTTEERAERQEAFSKDDVPVIVATVAFGMGINKPNIRYVIHYDIPKNIESYYQETGRAGRDGLPAEAVLLFDPADIPRVKRLFQNIPDEHRQRVEEQRFSAMTAFAEAQTCRRQVLLNYFNEFNSKPCGNCDICLDPPSTFDGTQLAQKALSCVYRLAQSFGIGYTIEVLRGAKTQRIKDNGHEKLSTYGIGAEQSHEYWLSVFRQLIHHGLLIQDITQNSVLKLTESARPILRGERVLMLAEPRINHYLTLKKTSKSQTWTNYDKKLFAQLRHLRKTLADDAGVPPYIVFSDATLTEMAGRLPCNEHEFLNISGVGRTKLQRYGTEFIALIKEYSESYTA